jgi:hypothetical protein
MKLFRFSAWLNESVGEFDRDAELKRIERLSFLQQKGMTENPLDAVEQLANRYSYKVTHRTDKAITLEMVKWETDTWHHDRRKQGVGRPNHYNFTISIFGAEPGMVRVLWHSMKHGVQEFKMENDAQRIINKIATLSSPDASKWW